jgi:hypothetical protein
MRINKIYLIFTGLLLAAFTNLSAQSLIKGIVGDAETNELMIGVSAKEAEEKSTEVVLKSRHSVRRQYWEHALEAFHNSSCTLFNNISPSKDHWISAGSGVRGCPFNLIFGQKLLRVEFYISRASKEENKFIFDFLHGKKEKIEENFGAPLEWMRLDNKKASRVQYECKADGFNKEKWDEWVDWHLTHMTKLEKSFKAPLQQVTEALKMQTFE